MLKLSIKTDNQAFQEGCRELEVCACLTGVIQKIKQGYTEAPVYDTNGNVVGNFKFTNK